VLPVVAVAVAVVAAVVTQLVTGDLGDVAVPVLVAALVGLVLGVVAILVVEAADGTIRDPRDLIRLTSAPNLAVVPRHQLGTERPEDVTMFRDPNSIEAEGYRSLRTALEFVLWPPDSRLSNQPGKGSDAATDDTLLRPLGDGPGKVVLVTSARPGEGKSSVAANLAAASAMAGRRVVLVDGDLRKPQVHRLFRLKNEVGLSSMLTGELKGFAAVQRLEATKHLVVVSGGPPPPDPAELLASPRLGATLASMSSQADLVVVDAPPLLAVTDPTVIAQHCDATILVAIAGDSDRREWVEALRRLALVRADVIGTVLMQPDDRANATPAYRYAPSAAPKNWWVAETAASETAAPATPTQGAAPVEPVESEPVESEPVESEPVDPAPVDAAPVDDAAAQPVDVLTESVDTAETAEPVEPEEPAEVVESEEPTELGAAAEAPAEIPGPGDDSVEPSEAPGSAEAVDDPGASFAPPAAPAGAVGPDGTTPIDDVWAPRRTQPTEEPADHPLGQQLDR
jgi:capsular exopolysaccharide synthesis family protein